MEHETELQQRLLALRDEAYREFNAALMPTVDKETVIGVRMPLLRKLAKEFAGSQEAKHFLDELPHRYYEENNIHALMLMQLRDYDACVAAVDEFLPYINNWSTCDLLVPQIFGMDLCGLKQKCREWMASSHPYTVRFGIKMLMTFFLDENFSPDCLTRVAEVHPYEYYVNMMCAWYFATALAKQYAATVPYLEEMRLSRWVHNKTIQKAVESFRITPEQKAYLKTLRIKK